MRDVKQIEGMGKMGNSRVKDSHKLVDSCRTGGEAISAGLMSIGMTLMEYENAGMSYLP